MARLFLPLLFSLIASTSTLAGAADVQAKLSFVTPVERCFPASIDGFETANFSADRISSFKAYRNTILAGYNVARYHLSVTVYVYDRLPGGDAAQELKDVMSEILAAYPGAESAKSRNSEIQLSGKPTEGAGAVFLWSHGTTSYGSFLWLFTSPQHHLKIRATYELVRGKEVDGMDFALASVNAVAKSICTPD